MHTSINLASALAVTLGVSLLGGCALSPESASPAEDAFSAELAADSQNASPEVAVNTALDSAKQKSDKRMERLLEAGDLALEEDRLMTPLGNNAYDRYRAVLLMEPNNLRARSGLQAISLRYLELARSATQKGRLPQAQAMLERAVEVDPLSSLVARMRQALQQALQQQRQAPPLEEDDKIYQLNPYHLSQRAPELVEELHRVARQVRENEEFVLIISRTDEEGRWIYQQMRDAVPGYLLRGNIHLGSQPRLELKP